MLTWVLVADAGLARVFTVNDDGRALTEIADFKEAGRQYPDETGYSDRPSRVQESASPARHAVEPRTSLKTQSARRFARELSDFLGQGLRERRCRRLVMVAPARFASVLQQELDAEVAKSVSHWLRKDLIHHPPVKLFDQVQDWL